MMPRIFDHDPCDLLPALDRAIDAINCGQIKHGDIIAVHDPNKRVRGVRGVRGGLRRYLVHVTGDRHVQLIETRGKLTP